MVVFPSLTVMVPPEVNVLPPMMNVVPETAVYVRVPMVRRGGFVVGGGGELPTIISGGAVG